MYKGITMFNITKLHLTGSLKGLQTNELTNVLFELNKIYTSITNSKYKVINIVYV